VGTAAAENFSVPEGVREVVGRRVSRLSAETGELLTVAAVMGPQFDAAIAAEVSGQTIAGALDGFDEATTARLLLETSVPGQLRFPHALVRQTLEDELSTLRRLHLHQQIGLALERRFGDADSAVAELAHHFGEAAAVGEGERAARYAERAAILSLDRAAPEQAVDLFERALEVIPPEIDPQGARRGDLYGQLAHCLWAIFDAPRLEAACRRWLALAHELDDDATRLLAEGWFVNSFIGRGVLEPADVAEVAGALRVDPWSLDLEGRRRFSFLGRWNAADAAALRTTLLAGLSVGWSWGVPFDGLADDLPAATPLALADEALRLAAESTDRDLENDVRYCRLSPLAIVPDAEVLLDEAQRIVGIGYRTGGGGRHQMGLALARLGRLDELLVLADQMRERGEQTGDRLLPTFACHWQAAVALARGRYEDAQRATEQMLAALPEQPAVQLTHGVHMFAVLLGSGQSDQARAVAEMIESVSPFDSPRLNGVVAVAQMDLETPRTVIDAWRASGHQLPDDMSRPGRLWGLAACALAIGDDEAADHLYDHVRPYDGQLLVYDYCYAPASAAFVLGMVAETQGDRVRALAHYTEALAFEEQIGAEGLADRTRRAVARIS
jgi:tetratricopeptide (TPR) repeat protein